MVFTSTSLVLLTSFQYFLGYTADQYKPAKTTLEQPGKFKAALLEENVVGSLSISI